ncbi:MAG: hypothetical protein WA715_26805, partial [Candidatus Acidiferrum sp.]
LHYTAHAPAFTEKLRPAHFIDGFVGVLQNVKLVVDDAAVPRPLYNAVGVRRPPPASILCPAQAVLFWPPVSLQLWRGHAQKKRFHQ